MTLIKKILLAFNSLIILVSCAENHNYSFNNDSCNETDLLAVSIITRSACNNDSDSFYFVSGKDLDSYIQFKKMSLKQDELTVVDMAPLTDESGDTWAYSINYSDGWELISADKRYSNHCTFSSRAF